MSTKKEGVGCYDKAAEDEPLFVIRAQDSFAPKYVELWAHQAEVMGVNAEKVKGARQVAGEMLAWQKANPDKVKIPD
jgi:hypothetical protein